MFATSWPKKTDRARISVEELEDRCVLSTIFALNAAGTSLLRFDSATPNAVTTVGAIGGLAGTETVLGIDFRPATGQLFGVIRDSGAVGNNARLAIINTANATTTTVGTGFTFTLDTGDNVSIDFNPTVDRLRVVTDDTTVANDDDNFRVNPADGVAIADTNLAFAPGDLSTPANASAVGIGYTNNFAGATTTTLYAIDFGLDRFLTQGGLNGLPSPNSGKLFTIGGLGENTTNMVGLDITADNMTFASLTAPAATNSRLFTIPNLGFGAASPTPATPATANVIGDALTGTIRDIAVAPAGVLQFSAATFTVSENGGTVLITVNRTGGGDGTVSVNWSATAGSATAGSDFTAGMGTLTFLNGEVTKTFTVAINQDVFVEGNETVNLTLSSPTGGAGLGAMASSTLTITDDTQPPVTNVSNLVTVSVGPAKHNRLRGRTRVRVTIGNPGTNGIFGPLTLLLSNLPRGVRLRSPDGTSQGNPLKIVVPAGSMLNAGGSMSVDLEFNNPLGRRVRFGTAVFAGVGAI